MSGLILFFDLLGFLKGPFLRFETPKISLSGLINSFFFTDLLIYFLGLPFLLFRTPNLPLRTPKSTLPDPFLHSTRSILLIGAPYSILKDPKSTFPFLPITERLRTPVSNPLVKGLIYLSIYLSNRLFCILVHCPFLLAFRQIDFFLSFSR